MAGGEVGDSRSTSGLTPNSGHVGVTEPQKSLEDENLKTLASQDTQDLKSVLVTSVLNLEKLDVDLYRGTHHWVPRTQRLFGGQIIGQALVAAAKSVSDNFYAHSLHCYFVRAGDPKVPVLYQVDRTRDGRSFTVRSVKAVQHGQPILICQASFQKLQPSPLEHQFTMPSVPPPEDLLTVEELIRLHLSKPDLAEDAKKGLNKLLANEVPIEIKPVSPAHFYRFTPSEPRRLFWGRARGYIGEGNMKLHCCVAAYVSDFALLGTAMQPYPNYRAQFAASLDHAMWFHSTFCSDEWMLYECESSWAGSSRGLVQGRIWRRDGVLAASCSQEGLLRVKPVPESSKL
ncbi:acyl-coenzyme A thioesterase 8 [Amphiprion ocellaris]|uniref:Acyl-coenzyme A thioesterase 8 n=1 Tax=Amphiprion ocellaris TaxID=80972 RepID=A0A3Q1AJP2_AMPOC|nr:acyl-coenzyme A thioesterase 8 [Amphiprion ocellaris]